MDGRFLFLSLNPLTLEFAKMKYKEVRYSSASVYAKADPEAVDSRLISQRGTTSGSL